MPDNNNFGIDFGAREMLLPADQFCSRILGPGLAMLGPKLGWNFTIKKDSSGACHIDAERIINSAS